jgi:putative ABC transport system permease protein
VTVSPGATRTGATRGAIGSATTLTLDDADALTQLEGVQAVAPELTTSKLIVAGSQNETTRIVGTTPAYLSVFAYQMWVGSFINEASVDHNLRVAVIGATTADNLGLTDASLGSTINIGGLPFELIGILQPKGGTTTADDQVVIPLSTAHELFIGSNSVSAIGLSATSQDAIPTVSAEITAALEQRHGITNGVDDFSIATQAQLLGTVSSVSDVLTLLLAGIASISLFVGGIGIMNIMLVSVRERTREIGIRKAVGARGRDILSQFLVEALTLSLAGGVIGIGVGVVASLGIGTYAGWGFVFNPATVVVAVGFSLVVGIVFGVWPASQAARLDPVVALRYE